MPSQIVLISGCSSGIGLATAVHLAKDAEERFKVYATMRNLAKKGQLEEEGKEYLGKTLIIKQMDVCSDESVNKAVQEVLEAEGKIDVLYNNAGKGFGGPLESIPMNMAQELMNVNFFGTLRLIKAVLPSMKARQSGHIINCSSEMGVIGVPFHEIYSASKFAIEGLSEGLAPTLRQFNIRCTILEPGPVVTKASETAEASSAAIEKSAADQKTQELMKICIDKLTEIIVASTPLEPNKIATVVEEIVLGKNTNFRCQTNVDVFSGEIALKLKDPTSNEPIDLIEKRIYGERKD